MYTSITIVKKILYPKIEIFATELEVQGHKAWVKQREKNEGKE
jgi:hypothetical protein